MSWRIAATRAFTEPVAASSMGDACGRHASPRGTPRTSRRRRRPALDGRFSDGNRKDSDTPSETAQRSVKSMPPWETRQGPPIQPNGQGMCRLLGEHPNGRENSPTIAHSTQRPTVIRSGWVARDGTDLVTNPVTTRFPTPECKTALTGRVMSSKTQCVGRSVSIGFHAKRSHRELPHLPMTVIKVCPIFGCVTSASDATAATPSLSQHHFRSRTSTIISIGQS